MYWPIGAPSIFEQEPFEVHGRVTHDGLDDKTSLHAASSAAANGSGDESALKKQDGVVSAQSAESASLIEVEADAQSASESTGGLVSAQTDGEAGLIVDINSSRSGHIFATVTRTTLTIWQSKPAVILASVIRSDLSLKTYGHNIGVLLRPDAAIVSVQTVNGYLITYSLSIDPGLRSYQLIFEEEERRQARKRGAYGPKHLTKITDESSVIPRVNLRFRMVIKFDAGISIALALEDELIVATTSPPAVQCIRWSPDSSGSQTSTELLSKMTWLQDKEALRNMVYDRPMNLYAWISTKGTAYAVQRSADQSRDQDRSRPLFLGHAFHSPTDPAERATQCAINAKFSLIAVACKDASVWVYNIRDYSGGITFMFRLQASPSLAISGPVTGLTYSPDGYCLFTSFEKGWSTWSVYGQQGGTSFGTDRQTSAENDDHWLLGVSHAFWFGGGSELMLATSQSRELYGLKFARSAATSCFSPANLSKALLQTPNSLMVYQGQDLSDLTTISTDVSLWHSIQVPSSFLHSQWPIRAAVISSDGRYLAVAGQRGLAHYSIGSGRWRTFDDTFMENSFFVRGGMCWHQNILIVAVETNEGDYQLRMYSRDQPLDDGKMLHSTTLVAPVVQMVSSGDDSILVYTTENVLHHYVVVNQRKAMRLVKVGQIGLHGIVRAPSRVRAINWIVPDYQLQTGDPSQDVTVASVLFLVDGKLVLLQPSASESGELKYDLRIISDRVESFFLARDSSEAEGGSRNAHANAGGAESTFDHGLRDSLWLFDGQSVKIWPEVNALLAAISSDYGMELPKPIQIPVDFYPLSLLLQKAIIAGVEADMVQKRFSSFGYSRVASRTTLFLPNVLRHFLSHYDSPAALSLSHRYSQLPYFAHALEVLLHGVLDDEVDKPTEVEDSQLPAVLSFLSSFPEYLDIVVQCTRKTEARSWRTLFTHLPPPRELFETSLEAGALKTAGGYLLVLHTMEEAESTSPQVIRLLRAARRASDWELCKELARFLIALDDSGDTLREALAQSSATTHPEPDAIAAKPFGANGTYGGQ